MCGIVGYVGQRPAVEILVEGLKLLEYRGYDSAGVAFLNGDRIEVIKSEGKLENVEKLLERRQSADRAAPPPGSPRKEDARKSSTCGIGHTRWATHGKPTTQNAHPHRAGHVVLVHNGIIENYQEIKKELAQLGHHPQSETDSELFGFLVLERMNQGQPFVKAVRESFLKLQGQCSVVVMSEKEPGTVIGVRNGSPLVAALDQNNGKCGVFLASDAQPLLKYTREVIFLENGDMAIATRDGMKIQRIESGEELERKSSYLDWSIEKLDKQGYAHYMLKEIHEQPSALIDTLNGLLDRAKLDAFPLAHQPGVGAIEKARELTLVACGTAWHAALAGQYWLERWGKVRCSVELASEFRYRSPVLSPQGALIAISQSGETADTLAAVREAKAAGVPTLAITNCRGSTISREADATLYTSAGPEVGVAATKTFSTQMLTLLLIAGHLAARRGNAQERDKVERLFESLVTIPHRMAESLSPQAGLVDRIRKAALELQGKRGFFFIGRGYCYPLALEGALKLKEISYVHAEGYAAGELKHGPIAMIDKDMAVVVLAPRDQWRDKTISNLEEVKARGATIVGLGDPRDAEMEKLCSYWLPLVIGEGQAIDESLYPFLLAPMIQLLSYEIALLKGTDVDKPRNLAKSVTVE